jgi:hypothetical protein
MLLDEGRHGQALERARPACVSILDGHDRL